MPRNEPVDPDNTQYREDADEPWQPSYFVDDAPPQAACPQSAVGDVVTTRTYDRPNRGALFPNDFKRRETDCDYSGKLNIGGSTFSVSGWVSTSKSGVKFLRLSVKPKPAGTAGSSASAFSVKLF